MIDLNDAAYTSVMIESINGSTVFCGDVRPSDRSGHIVIRAGTLSAGVYLVKVTDGQENRAKGLMIVY